MSVINRMLRDLDQRQQQQSKGSYIPAAMAPQPLHWSWMIGIAVGTSVVIIVLLNIYWWLTTDSISESVTVDPQVAVVAEDAEAKLEPKLEPKLEAAAETEIEPDVVESQVLTSEETSQAALKRGPVKPKELVQVPTVASVDTSTDTSNANASDELDTTQELQPAAAVEINETPATFAVERVQLSPNELAETNLQKARSALRRGERELGQELLEKALTVMPEHVAVRSELAAYWYGRGFATRAVAILQQGIALVPQQSQWQLLLGRILERMGRIEDAYMALQSLDPSTAEYPGLLEVRGNAANQLGYFTEAAQDYLALANLNSEGRWWLAAAVAFEDSGDAAAAFRAYQQAAFARDLGSDARGYAEDRLQALGGS